MGQLEVIQPSLVKNTYIFPKADPFCLRIGTSWLTRFFENGSGCDNVHYLAIDSTHWYGV